MLFIVNSMKVMIVVMLLKWVVCLVIGLLVFSISMVVLWVISIDMLSRLVSSVKGISRLKNELV